MLGINIIVEEECGRYTRELEVRGIKSEIIERYTYCCNRRTASKCKVISQDR